MTDRGFFDEAAAAATVVEGVGVRDVDIVIVGAGAAGLSLARRLTDPGREPTAGPCPSVAVVDAPAGPLRPPERTWCFWEEAGGEYDDMVAASWDGLRVTASDGTATTVRPAPLRYKMIRSTCFEERTGHVLSRAGCLRFEAVVDAVRDVPGGVEVRGRDGTGAKFLLRARWAFDSRPPQSPVAARTTLLQHFRGWYVRTEHARFDEGVADLMDFRTPQPAHGLSFGYVLPLSPHEALVEYTEFSSSVLEPVAYEQALRKYTEDVLGLGGFDVTATEQGVIPMTDARFPRRTGRSVFPIGAAGGATRPSTGYTFAAAQRHTRAIARALAEGRTPLVPAPYPRRSRLMDAVLLRALDTGRLDGSAFFSGLFRDVPASRLLCFLDGNTRWWEDVLVGLRTPVRPMLTTLLELPALPRRAHVLPRPEQPTR